MAKTKNTVKTGLISAAVGASLGAAAVALSDKKTRKKVTKSAKDLSSKTKDAAVGMIGKAKQLQKKSSGVKKAAPKKVAARKKNA